MSVDGGTGSGEPPNTPGFRIARAALETGKVAAVNENLEDETTVLVVVSIADPDSDNGRTSSLSTLQPEEHVELLSTALQSFADLTDQPIRVMYLGEEKNRG